MNRVAPGTRVGLVGEKLVLPRVVLVPKELVLGRVVLGGEELVLLPRQLLSLWQRHESLSVLKKMQKLKKWRREDEDSSLRNSISGLELRPWGGPAMDKLD